MCSQAWGTFQQVPEPVERFLYLCHAIGVVLELYTPHGRTRLVHPALDATGGDACMGFQFFDSQQLVVSSVVTECHRPFEDFAAVCDKHSAFADREALARHHG